ncbi:MAG: hypothetical protein V4712_17615 [Pseudomonadota bacterium]
MKAVLIISSGERQLDLIPENDAERAALKMIEPGTVFRAGKAVGYAACAGGYLRPFAGEGVSFTFLTNVEVLE